MYNLTFTNNNFNNFKENLNVNANILYISPSQSKEGGNYVYYCNA